MHKLIVVLMLAVSFFLGMFSQNLIAGNWVIAQSGETAPVLRPFGVIRSGGWTIYEAPKRWKAVKTNLATNGHVTVYFKRLE